jgi:exosortase/archaeosortase family protein
MGTTIKNYIKLLLDKLRPFKYIAWFLCLFLIFELIWKICVHQGENESILLVLGRDFTAYTHEVNLWTAKSIHWFVHDILGDHEFKIDGTFLYYTGSIPIEIVWGCTGLKQLFMFTFILACYYGPLKKKLWYIPLSLVILAFINILRLSIIFLIIKDPFPEWFISFNEWHNDRIWENTRECYYQFYNDWYNLFHKDIFTLIYYDGVIFILWLFWEEKIRKPYYKKLAAIKDSSPLKAE